MSIEENQAEAPQETEPHPNDSYGAEPTEHEGETQLSETEVSNNLTDEPEDLEFSYDGELLAAPTSEDDESEDDTQLVKHLRGVIKEQRKALRETKIKAPSQPAAAAVPQVETLPPYPKMDDDGIDYDPDNFQKAVREWHEKEARVNQQKAAAESAHNARVATFNERKTAYKARVNEMKIRGYEDAEAFVAGEVSEGVQTALILHADKPEMVVLALARNPDLLKQVQTATDPVQLGVLIGTIQAKAKAMPKAKTTLSSVPDAPRGNGKSQTRDIEAELNKARETGDYSRVVELKRQQKAAGKK